MPRLPVGNEGQPTFTVSWWAAALAFAALLAWPFGGIWLAHWLDIDLSCADVRGRRANVIEMGICAFAAGPRGWLWLVWVVGPFGFATWWLRRKLRRKTG